MAQPSGAGKDGSSSILDGPIPDLLGALAIQSADDDLIAASALVGGINALGTLLESRPPAQAVTHAWKTYLDTVRSTPTRAANTSELLVLLLIRRALQIANRDPRAMQAALNTHRLNWLGTWREVNLRVAGHLYAHGLRESRGRRDGPAPSAMRLAIECWHVIEPMEKTLSEGQRKKWRGMRGCARLFLARAKQTDHDVLLRGAIEDFNIAEVCGDRSAEHFQMLAEAKIRLFAVDADDALLAKADDVFGRARSSRADSAELIAQRGELLFARGLRAQAVADGADSTKTPEDLSEEPAQADESRDPKRHIALVAAESAFRAASMWWTMAVDRLAVRGLDAEVCCVRRGQALLRASNLRHRLGKPSDEYQEAALADLCRVDRDGAKIRSDYWPRGLCAKARRLIRQSEPDSLDQAAALIRRAAVYMREYVDASDPFHDRLVVLGQEVEVRQAIINEDLPSIRRLLNVPDFVVAAPIAPLIYASRLLCSARPVPSGDRELIEHIVDRLEVAASESQGGARVFAASHAGTLLYLGSGSGPVEDADLSVLERIYALFKLAEQEVTDIRASYQLARAASRLARRLVRMSTVETHARAVELFGEAISALKLAAVDVETSDATEVELRTTDDDWFVPDATDNDVGSEQTGLELRSIASLLGDCHLRRYALSYDRDDLDQAISWLQGSIDLGNNSPECLGVLGDAYMRRGKRTRDPRALQRGIDLKTGARERLQAAGLEVARENFSSSASAAAMIWRITREYIAYESAVALALQAEAADPASPWPLLQLAELADAHPNARAQLATQPPALPGLQTPQAHRSWVAVRDGLASELSREACLRAANNEEFMQTVLGGRSQTYVLEDPHGLLSATLVLKPVDNAEQAQNEQARLSGLREYLAHGSPEWAAVPEPMAIIEAEEGRRTLFTTRRAAGRPLSDLIADALLNGSSIRQNPPLIRALQRTSEFLAMIHAWGGSPTDISRTARRTRVDMTKRLSVELSRLGAEEPDEIARRWMSLVPARLPLVTKRDAHTENWLITDAGSVVALDLQASTYLPVGFELAQLIEDMPAFPAHDMQSRNELAELYLKELRIRRPQFGGALPDAQSDEWQSAYACFAARRAIFTLARSFKRRSRSESSGSMRLIEARRDHARAVLRQNRSIVPGLVVFEEVLAPDTEQKVSK